MDPIVYVTNSANKHHALVFLVILEYHLVVDRNVLSVPTVNKTELASIRNVKILARMLVLTMHYVWSVIIMLFVAALVNTPVIHSSIASLWVSLFEPLPFLHRLLSKKKFDHQTVHKVALNRKMYNKEINLRVFFVRTAIRRTLKRSMQIITMWTKCTLHCINRAETLMYLFTHLHRISTKL